MVFVERHKGGLAFGRCEVDALARYGFVVHNALGCDLATRASFGKVGHCERLAVDRYRVANLAHDAADVIAARYCFPNLKPVDLFAQDAQPVLGDFFFHWSFVFGVTGSKRLRGQICR